MARAAKTRSARQWVAIDQPTMRRLEASTGGVENHGKEEESLSGGDIRAVGDPDRMRRAGDNRSLQQIGGARLGGIAAGGPKATAVTARHPGPPQAAGHALA